MICFTFDSTGLKEYRNDQSIIQEDIAVLEVTAFVLPVSFTLDGVDLFEIPIIGSPENEVEENNLSFRAKPSWLPMPVLNLALNGMKAVQEVCRGETVDFVLPDVGSRLLFEPIGNEVKIYSGINRKSALTTSGELLQTFETFLNEVRRALRKGIPQLLKHPDLGIWLSKEE